MSEGAFNIYLKKFNANKMAIISKSRLAAIADPQVRYKTFSQVLNEARSESRYYSSTSIFLSHSHNDLEREDVKRAIAFFRNLGLRIYVDSDDSSMPPYTNGTTATKIKDAIKTNKKFILLASNRAIESVWCNWELGYGDSFKYVDHLALFPLAEDSGNWKGNEYLQIYPRIEEGSYNSANFNVVFPSGKSLRLQDWLTN